MAKTKEEIAAYMKAYKAANKEKLAAYKKAWAAANREKTAAYNRAHYEANREKEAARKKTYYEANREKAAAQGKAYKQANPDKHNAHEAKRRATKLNATPQWLTQDHLAEIETFYTDAANRATPHHVDHIVPLQGDNVSGLHVPWNLQVIPASENCSKGNRITE